MGAAVMGFPFAEAGAARQAGPEVAARWSAPWRRLRDLAAAGLAALALSACQVVPRDPTPRTPPPPPTQTTPSPVITPGLPQDVNRHRVALLVPRTGENADVGESIANATTLALLDTKTERVRMTTYDTAMGAEAAARQAIADGNRLILGPLLSADVAAVARVARAANVPVISFSNDTTVAGNGVFILGFVPGQSVDRVVRHAHGQGARRFAALVPASTYGERAGQAFTAAVRAVGGTMVAQERYDRSAPAMLGAARRLKDLGAVDALLIADSGGNAARIVPTLRSGAGAQARMLGTELWNTDAALASSAVMRGSWFASVPDNYYNELAKKYRARYGKAPFRLASLGYDAVLLTVRISREWTPGTTFPQNRLLARDGFGGIDGIFRFDRRGIAVRALEVSEVATGGFRVVDPALKAWSD